MKPLAVALAAAVLALLGPAACLSDTLESYGKPGRLVRLPDGRRMNLRCVGSGPVVIFDSGLGGTTLAWNKVQERLSDTFQACSYDRAGIGFSDPGPMPRDTRNMAEDLHQLLKASGLRGPYILVGHSLGGLTMRYYALKHRREVAGLVLADPSGERQDARLFAAIGRPPPADANAGRRACLAAAEKGLTPGTEAYNRCVGAPNKRWPQALQDAVTRMKMDPAFHRTQVSEFDSLADIDSAQVQAAGRSLGSLPVVVLTAENTYRTGVPPAYADTLSQVWMTMHDEVAAMSSRGENRLVRGSGHQMPNDDPVSIAQAVRDVAVMARSRR